MHSVRATRDQCWAVDWWKRQPSIPLRQKAVVLLALLTFALASMPILAQSDASRVAPRDLRPDYDDAPPSLPQERQRAPQPPDEGDDGSLSVMVGKVIVEGGFDELQAASAKLIMPFQGRQTTVNELHSLASALELLYQQEGYFLARVTIPPQTVVDDGDIRLQVVDGYLEALDLGAVPEGQRAVLTNTLQPLLQQRRLKRDAVERRLTLAGRIPGFSLRSTLVPGEQVGGVTLVLQGEQKVFGGSLSQANRLSDDLGPWESTLQTQLNQPLGYGEQIYGYFSWNPGSILLREEKKRRVKGMGVKWPLGHNGLMLNLELMQSNTYLASSFLLIPDTSSRFERASLRLTYPIWLTRSGELDITAALEATDQVNHVPEFDFDLSHDRLRVLRLNTQAHRQITPRSRLSLFLQVSQGFNQGARTEADVRASGIPFSRIGADPNFTKMEATLGWNLTLSQYFWLNSTLRGQYAFGSPLPSSELFGLDGETALSSLVSGTLANDGGWTLREELGMYVPPWRKLRLSPYIYGSGGKPSSELTNNVGSGLAAGVGLRGGVGSISIGLEYGYSRINFDNTADVSGNEFFVSMQGRF